MSTVEFKKALEESTFTHNRAIARSTSGLDLGVFSELSQELIQRTLTDSLKREYLYVTLVTPEGKILVNKEVQQGETFEARSTFRVEVNMNMRFSPNRRLRQNVFFGAGVHSHPIDMPPSPTDMTTLMYSDMEPDAATAAFVATPYRTIVIFRGLNTPPFSRLETQAKTELWDRNLRERIRTFERSDMTNEEFLELNRKAQDAQINQIAKKYDMSLFTGSPTDRVLRRGQL